MPLDPLDDPVDVLLELPDEPALAHPGLAEDRDQPDRPVLADRVEELPDDRERAVPADERALGQLAPSFAPAEGDDLAGLPGRDRLALAAKRPVAGVLEGDRAGRHPVGRVVDQDGPRPGRRLEPRGRVDDVARDHPLADGADGDGRLPADDACPGLEPGESEVAAESGHRRDQVEAGPDRPLRVVLVGDRGAPHGHDRVADELLDGPAVAGDDLATGREVALEKVPHLLGVATLGQGRERDEVDEEDRDMAPLGDRRARRLGDPVTARARRRAGCDRPPVDHAGASDRISDGRPARAAEAELAEDGRRARRAAGTERTAAAAAEPRRGRVRRPACLAACRHRRIIARRDREG